MRKSKLLSNSILPWILSAFIKFLHITENLSFLSMEKMGGKIFSLSLSLSLSHGQPLFECDLVHLVLFTHTMIDGRVKVVLRKKGAYQKKK